MESMDFRSNNDIPGEAKKLACLADYGIKSVWQIFKTEVLIYKSKVNLDENILFANILHPRNQKMLVKGHTLLML